jgi:uncharacterized protein YdeI (YjbR/CyaY-like superfamily)
MLEVRDRPEWREWLQHHHTSSRGVWLVLYKKHTGAVSIPYEDAVCEALCFGWIDSLIKRIDGDRHAHKFTPRKSSSKWSESNRKRWAELRHTGLLTSAGLAAAPSDNTYGPKPRVPVLPAYIAKAFQRNPRAWMFFQELAPTDRRQFVVWIHLAKRPETRDRRISESINLLAARKKLGLK